jgi:hypothetical protein
MKCLTFYIFSHHILRLSYRCGQTSAPSVLSRRPPSLTMLIAFNLFTLGGGKADDDEEEVVVVKEEECVVIHIEPETGGLNVHIMPDRMVVGGVSTFLFMTSFFLFVFLMLKRVWMSAI